MIIQAFAILGVLVTGLLYFMITCLVINGIRNKDIDNMTDEELRAHATMMNRVDQ